MSVPRPRGAGLLGPAPAGTRARADALTRPRLLTAAFTRTRFLPRLRTVKTRSWVKPRSRSKLRRGRTSGRRPDETVIFTIGRPFRHPWPAGLTWTFLNDRLLIWLTTNCKIAWRSIFTFACLVSTVTLRLETRDARTKLIDGVGRQPIPSRIADVP
jgi:hypothetical protein